VAVTDEAITRIKQMITTGQLKPGDRLPREADLAAEIGVSRNSLREAVQALRLVRILDVRRGDGTFVASLAPESLMEAINFLLEFRQDSSVLESLEMRRILEPAAAAAAARLMTPADVAGLRDLVERTRRTDEISGLVRCDLEFHSAIAAGSRNSLLASLVDTISMPTARARVWRGLTQQDAVGRTIAEHSAIVDAIENQDAELAAARALVHVSGVLEWMNLAKGGTPE
jgi:GntR family transcriptional regulator, transcriptional repressor for pyruvate dehydrogenase complex